MLHGTGRLFFLVQGCEVLSYSPLTAGEGDSLCLNSLLKGFLLTIIFFE